MDMSKRELAQDWVKWWVLASEVNSIKKKYNFKKVSIPSLELTPPLWSHVFEFHKTTARFAKCK
jgi:hypothetical protein